MGRVHTNEEDQTIHNPLPNGMLLNTQAHKVSNEEADARSWCMPLVTGA